MQEPTDPPNELPDAPPTVLREAVQRWRLVVARDRVDSAAQRDQLAAWEAALVASGLPLAGLDAPRPRSRFAIAAPLAAAIPGEAELVDIWLVERLPAWRVREALAAHLPTGHRLVDVYDVWLGEGALPGRVVASVYRTGIEVPPAALVAACEALMAAGELPRVRRKSDALVAYDLRPFLVALVVEPRSGGEGSILRMTLRHDSEKGVGRPEEALAALGEVLGVELDPGLGVDGPVRGGLVRESLVLAEPVPPPPSPPRRPGARPPRR